MLAKVLTNLDSTFDNHAMHRQLLRMETIAFAEALLDFKKARNPYRAFSDAFGKWVGQEFKGQIRKRPATGSNHFWKKVNPNEPIV